MPLPNLPERQCACGCGRSFIPRRIDHLYYNKSCKDRAYKKRHKGAAWVEQLHPLDKRLLDVLSRAVERPALQRVYESVSLVGSIYGVERALDTLSDCLYVSGFDVINLGDFVDVLWAFDNPGHFIPFGHRN